MKDDIKNIEDIKLLVNTFYEKVQKDDTIGYIFNDVIKVDWETHLPKMYSFWHTVLFGVASYKGNPMLVHLNIDAKEPLNDTHFQRWVTMWEATIDHLFQGAKADEAKLRGSTMRQLMMMKINQRNQNKHFIQ